MLSTSTASIMHKRIREGQVWEYRDSTGWGWPNIPVVSSLEDSLYHCDCALEITKIEVTAAFKIVTVMFLKDDGRGPYLTGDEAHFTDDSFQTPHFRFLWEPSGVIVKQYGVYCGKCGDYYPHTEKKMNFACWACRNGW